MFLFKPSTKKKYYSTAILLLSTVPYLSLENIKKFIEVKCGEKCEIDVLEKALDKFRVSTENRYNGKWYSLSYEQKEKEKMIAPFSADDIYNICFGDYMDNVRASLDEIFAIIEDSDDTSLFEKGISKKILGDIPLDYSPQSKIAAKIVAEEMIRRILDDDHTARRIAAEEVVRWLSYYYEKDKYEEYVEHLYSVGLRAVHYEEFGGSIDEYESITEEECRSAVSNAEYYSERINKSPFDKDSIIESSARKILETTVILAANERDWKYWTTKDSRFIDSACNYAWKAMSKNRSTEIEDAVLYINTYIVKQNK